MATRWVRLLVCRAFFDVSGVVGSGEGWRVDGGGWQQWMRVVMWLMALLMGITAVRIVRVGPVGYGWMNSVESMFKF